MSLKFIVIDENGAFVATRSRTIHYSASREAGMRLGRTSILYHEPARGCLSDLDLARVTFKPDRHECLSYWSSATCERDSIVPA